jgi:predicted O-methyltransferase YrrM
MFNEDWYSLQQLNDLENLLEKVKGIDGQIIEIGCWEGKSTIRLAKTCFPEVLICNDTWLGNVAESQTTGVLHITEKIVKERDVYATFLDNMELHTDGNYHVVKQDCIEWLKTYKDPIKFIHIDASHEYESVAETIRLALPHVVKGGILCGDDYLSANINCHELHGGVERAVKEMLPGHSNMGNLWYFINT